MTYWHLQMAQPSGRGGGHIDSSLLLKEGKPVIGTGEWVNAQCDNFKHNIAIGDIVCVKEGGRPIALCRVTSENFNDEDLESKYISQNYRYVDVLEFYEGNDSFPQPQGTLSRAVNEDTATWQFINNWYNSFMKIEAKRKKEEAMRNIIKVLEGKKQIILQGPPGSGKTYAAKDIAEKIIFDEISEDKKEQKQLLESSDQFKLIQFHPAYSYEDFVRGIVAKTNGTQIEYKTENKLFAKFAEEAYNNWKASQEPKEKVAREIWVSNTLDDFKDYISEEIEDQDGKLKITKKAYIHRVTENSIRYRADAWEIDNGVPVTDIVKMYLADTTTTRQIKDNPELTKSAKSLSNYWLIILELFKKYIKDNKIEQPDTITTINEKKYILIIDEINRANLPAVLGELIYALEYRGENVESMYETEEDGNKLIIPPNLYIIGTMNNSDRSVGHIDYAIRRRFAFIDVLPKALEIENFQLDLFKQVAALFIKNYDGYAINNAVPLEISEHLSEEFRPEDVWLGHSYFIKGDGDFELRKKYEIIPILKEYVKDGILKQSAESIINAL